MTSFSLLLSAIIVNVMDLLCGVNITIYLDPFAFYVITTTISSAIHRNAIPYVIHFERPDYERPEKRRHQGVERASNDHRARITISILSISMLTVIDFTVTKGSELDLRHGM